MKCTIVLCTLNEEKYILRTLESLNAQTARKDAKILLIDSNSTDATVAISKPHVDKALVAERGKLTARDYGTRMADTGVVVSCDADTFYPPDWLANTLLEFQLDKEVVAVTGPRVMEHPLGSIQGHLSQLVWRLYGSNSAYLKKAYEMSGGFDLSINQRDSQTMVNEEEVLFRDRLAAFGRVVYQPFNPVYTSARRFVNNDREYNESRHAGQRF